jgi:LysR family glycine cleavage system transcriptional activator
MHNGRMSLKALRTFEAVVRNRSMAKAADELHVSAGAVGFQIRALEAELGFRLFDRVGGEMLPTEAAIEVSRQIRGGFEQVFGAVQQLRLSRDPGFLTVNCDVTFGMLWLGPRIADFQDQHPDIEVRLNLTDDDPELTLTGADIAISSGDGQGRGLRSVRLTSEAVSPVCAPGLLGSKGTIFAADLTGMHLLHVEWFSPETLFRTLTWDEWFALAGVALADQKPKGTHFSHTASAIQLATAGKGVALASECLVADAIAAEQLVRPVNLALRMPWDYHLAHSERVADLHKVRAFNNWILAETATFRTD